MPRFIFGIRALWFLIYLFFVIVLRRWAVPGPGAEGGEGLARPALHTLRARGVSQRARAAWPPCWL